MSKRKDSVKPAASSSAAWDEAVRYFNRTGHLRGSDVCVILGDPVGGVIITAEPDKETAYRLAGYGG